MTLKLELTFNNETYRHFMNGHPTVLHCHHYMSLTTKLAEEFAGMEGPRILREATEDSLRPVFDDYFRKNAVVFPDDRLQVGCAYYAAMGMGRLEAAGSANGGEAKLARSHVDEGWIKKWSKHDKPINHFTCGYLAALFGAAFESSPRSYQVTETESIAAGAREGKFLIKLA